MIRLAARDGAAQGIDPARLAVGGDSAGANLALAAALALRDAGEKLLSFQLLIYGVYSAEVESPSWQRFGRGAGLSQTQFRWITRDLSRKLPRSNVTGGSLRYSPTLRACRRRI